MYHAAGGASLYATCPLDRHLRDIHTVNQHIANSPKVTETAGRMLLGLEPDPRNSSGTGCAAQPAGGHDVGAAP